MNRAGNSQFNVNLFCPGRLWSLRDMMVFDVRTFVSLAKEMKRLATVLDQTQEDLFRTDDQKKNDAKVLAANRDDLKAPGLDLCCMQIDRIINECGPGSYLKAKTLASMVDELSN
jgi:hypothetical protein